MSDRYQTFPQLEFVREIKLPVEPYIKHTWTERDCLEYPDWKVADCEICGYGIMYPKSFAGQPHDAAILFSGERIDCNISVCHAVIND